MKQMIFWPIQKLNIRKSAYVNKLNSCFFSVLIISLINSQSKFQIFIIFSCRHIGNHGGTPTWLLHTRLCISVQNITTNIWSLGKCKVSSPSISNHTYFANVILPNKSDVSAGSVVPSQKGLYASLMMFSQMSWHDFLAMLVHFCLLSANFLGLKNNNDNNKRNSADVVLYCVKKIILFH